ncbi:MAG TPA: DNA alkylation repair protein [Polyangiaceae bacterium]|nr:DNA alkylation repair protein [Polyangiaceae bacterium]
MSSTSAKPPQPASRKLKDLFDATLVQAIAAELSRAHPVFDAVAFTQSSLTGLTDLELTARGWQLAEAMQRHLPQPFARAAEVLIASLGAEVRSPDELGLNALRYMPHVFFVQRYGLDDFEVAMRVQYELTKRFSAESSIRPFLVKYPEATYQRLVEWTCDPNLHVRRLVSEGTRPRLPWATRLRAFQENPRPVLALLELLKDDPERYVQRSVANNLNDIGKDHPEMVVETCRRWSSGAPPARQWVVRHALRSLVKQGHAGALTVLGVGRRPEICISAVRVAPSSVRIGEDLRFSFSLSSSASKQQDLVVDYAVHFVKANGAARPKVFKLKRLTLAPRSSAELRGKVSFQAMTTRRHHSGRHRIELRVNGVAYPLLEVELKA